MVERLFCRVAFICPMVVVICLGRCLRIQAGPEWAERWGQDRKLPAWIAEIQVVVTG